MIKLNSKGFTIIEVMIAMAIFGIGILGVAKLQITATGDNTISRTMSEATTVIIDNIEQNIVNSDYDDIEGIEADDPDPIPAESGVDYNITRTTNDTIFENIKILDTDGNQESIKVNKVETTVEWKGRNFTITTYKAE